MSIYGLSTVDFYKTAKIGEKFIVVDEALNSYYFQVGDVVVYLGYSKCSCNYRGCCGKGRFMSEDGSKTKTFCMAWSAGDSSTCEWTFLKPHSRYPKIEVTPLESELFEL